MSQNYGKMYNRTIRLAKGCSLYVNEILIVNGSGVIVAPVSITGNLAISGTLSATGATTLSSTLALAGNFAIATNKFTVAASTGNTVVAGTLGVTGTVTKAGLTINSETPQTLTGAGAVNLTTMVTELVTTGANALTIAAGTQGQLKTIVMKTDGGDGTLTITNPAGFTTVVFNDAGDAVQLYYTTSKWYIVANQGCTLS